MILRALLALWTSVAPPMADHLWQSTFFVVLAAILAFALRKNQARVRYWVWLTASMKFLIPFSLLVALGSHLATPRVSTPAQAIVYSAVEDFSQPFAGQQMPVLYHQAPTAAPVSLLHLLPAIVVALWLVGIVVVLLRWVIGWVRISLILRRAVPIGEGVEFDALRRLESSLGVRKPIRLVLSPDWMEPGIFGIFRPVLIWPEGISRHLDDRHIEAILAHEVCHVRRQDNLTAVLHMLVEAVFWFHPLVWWMGARLEEERERACDEEVSLLCNQPHVYAESILRVCKFCSESPLACVSGITGADLKKRIVQIMTERVVRKLDVGRKLLLLAVGLGLVAVPIVLAQARAAQRMMLAAVDKAPIPIRTAAHAMIGLEEAPSTGEIAEVQREGQAPMGTTTAAAPEMAGRISGTLLYPNGTPVAGGVVLLTGARPGHNPEELSAKTAEDGRFAIDHLRYTDYWFGAEKEDEAYEDALAVSVRGGKRLTRPDGVTLSASAPASEVVLKLATKMGIFTGTVESQSTHEPVAAKLVFSEPLGAYDASGHRFYHWSFVTEVKGSFRVLVPPDKDLFLSVSADGYRTWFYPAGSGESYPDRLGHPWPPVHFKPGEQKRLQVELEPKAIASAVPVAMVPEKPTAESGRSQSQPQNTVAPLPRYEYEAATIKPSKGPGPYKKVGLWAAPDGFNAWFITPQQFISIAYGVESFQFSGGPSWLPSERFDIQAKMDAATTEALAKLSQAQRVLAQQQMLQALLADRFQLTVHRETKEGTIYTLVIGKGGPKLQEAKPGNPGADNMTSKSSGDLTAQAVPIARLVRNLTQMLGHPVSDKTELKGVYDFKLQFTPDDRLQSTSPLAPNARLPEPPADSNAPSLFDALQEQLGLKLESGKGPVEVIVIDHVERPSGN